MTAKNTTKVVLKEGAKARRFVFHWPFQYTTINLSRSNAEQF